MTQKIVYIIPGYMESEKTNPAYRKIAKFFEKKGIKSEIVKVDWKYRLMSDYVKTLLTEMCLEHPKVSNKRKKLFDVKSFIRNLDKKKEFYFIGFSFGAMIAFIASSIIKPKAQILLSLSPYFKEDLGNLKPYWKKAVGIKRLNDFKEISFENIAESVNCKTLLLYGEKEPKPLIKRVKDAKRKIRNSYLISVRGAKHDIKDKRYLEVIEQITHKLL